MDPPEAYLREGEDPLDRADPPRPSWRTPWGPGRTTRER